MPPAAPLPCNSASISERRATPVLAMATGPPVAKIAISASSLAAIDVKEAGPGVSASMDSLAASMKGLNMRKSTTTGDTDSSENESPLSQTDTPKETESPRFQALLRMTGGDRSRKDIKSYSHELDPKGVRLNDHWRPHSSNDIEEILVTLRSRFNSAKEKVDTELKVFAGNLVEILESAECADLSFQEGVEDLLVLARKCATMPPTYFRRECEAIVQEVDDRRQELPVGTLKQLHTKMLFILTRCTRLLQFEKQSGLDENGALHILHQKSEEVPAADRAWAVKASGRASFNDRRVLFSHRRVSNVIGRGSEAESSSARFSKSFEDRQTHDRSTISKQETILGSSTSDGLDVKQKSLPTSEKGTASLPSSLEAPGRTFQDQVRLGSECHLQPLTQRNGLTRNGLTSDTNLTRVDIASNGLSKVICRICDEEIASVCLEEHSRICAYVDRFDYKTLNTDERLLRLAELLERLLDLHNTTCSQSVVRGSGGDVQASTSSASEVDHGRNLSHLREAIHDCATRSAAQSDDIVNETSSSKCAQFLAPTGRSLTRITSQSDLSMACRISQFESGDLTQIAELADIARCVANANLDDGGGLEYLQSCMEDLEEALQQSKAVALTVFTFGRRIQGLVREKYLTTCDAELSSSDEPDVDGAYEEDAFRSTPVHPAYLKDRTTIEDFEIIKPISRGAFGRVFLARKRTTGDLFAIKILRKSDMMRKNAVESVQAERNILISVRNPFVVRFFYSFTCKDNLYLVMEYLNGGDLYSMLRNLGCLEEDMARTYIAELVLALEYLHSLGVVHRDLKPDNLLIAHDGHIKLTDFGLSRVGLINSTEDLSGPAPRRHLHESPQHREQPQDRSAVGTPDYLAPEILLGTGHGSTADWWSVGVILFELLTGVPPFNAEHPRIIFDNILNRNIPWPYVPEDMSFEAQDLIDRLLTWDPSQRLGAQGAEEVKAHPFFKDVQWDTLARQKAAFIPSLNSADDTSYFTSRHIWNSNSPEVVGFPNGEIGDSSDCGSSSGGSSNSMRSGQEDGGDKCGDLAEFDVTPSVKYSFSDFSYKNLSQLAEINYDLLLKTGEELK